VTHDGEYEIETGVRDIGDILQINKWKLNSTLSQWPNQESGLLSTCNMLNGTDGSALAPFQEPSGAAYIFSADICRSVQIHYEQPITYQGIPGLRFVTQDNFLNEIGPEFGTECFCTNLIGHSIARPDGCLYRGALDLSSCIGE
jgi:lysosome membrane protein 2